MNTYPLGQSVRLEAELRDGKTDALVDASSVTLTLQGPSDVSPVPQAVTIDGVGLVHATPTPTGTGIWRYRWASDSAPSAVKVGAFIVDATTP
jgi:hypothetical protein